MKTNAFMSTVAMLGLLGGCGGDDDVAMPATDQVPASALVSAQAFSGYAGSLPPDDRGEPLSLDNIEPPTSETDEPIEVN